MRESLYSFSREGKMSTKSMPRRYCAKEKCAKEEISHSQTTLGCLRASLSFLRACHPEKTKAIDVLAQLVQELPKNGFLEHGGTTVRSLEEAKDCLTKAAALCQTHTELSQKTRHNFCCRIEAILARYI